MSYLNYTDFIAFDNEKLTCSFGIFANLVETNTTFNLNNNTSIYIHSKSQRVEQYAKIILTSTYQDLEDWEVYDSVVDVNMCNGICQIKGYKDCMMFEFTENTCRISKQVQKPMNKLNNDGTGLAKRTIFVNEGNGILLTKLFWPTVRSDGEKFWDLRFEVEFSNFFDIPRTVYSNIERSNPSFFRVEIILDIFITFQRL